MRHSIGRSRTLPGPAKAGDWHTIGTLLPYLWTYKGRVLAALVALIGAKVANVGVPLLLKWIVDSLDPALAVWHLGQSAPADYHELFLNEGSSKGLLHVDVDVGIFALELFYELSNDFALAP